MCSSDLAHNLSIYCSGELSGAVGSDVGVYEPQGLSRGEVDGALRPSEEDFLKWVIACL